jgi:hypothetical protein
LAIWQEENKNLARFNPFEIGMLERCFLSDLDDHWQENFTSCLSSIFLSESTSALAKKLRARADSQNSRAVWPNFAVLLYSIMNVCI